MVRIFISFKTIRFLSFCIFLISVNILFTIVSKTFLYFFSERQLLDSELIADVLWSVKNMEPTLNLTKKNCTSSEFRNKEDDKAFTLAQENGFSLNPRSNFLVYKRKDAKIAWPSAVSLLCNK